MRVFLIAVLFLPMLLSAQTSVELQQAFLDLSHDGVLMNISAHPDDEDGSALAYYRMKYGVETHSVFFTRGEGGQNEIGPELYEELGALRTAETGAAAKLIGSEIHFLNLKDFGYSKTATETFRKWGGRTEVMRRLVFFIRTIKPDIIFTNHNTVRGHGHHQAVATTAISAFDAAADSTFFPEQLKELGVILWQPKKLFFRNFGRTDRAADVVNNILEVNKLRQLSYIDIASNALRMHRTQGMDKADLRRFTRGLSLYELVRSNSRYDRDTTNFFSGIDFWSRPQPPLLADIRSDLLNLDDDLSRDSLLSSISSMLVRITSLNDTGRLSSTEERIVAQWRRELEHLAQSLCGTKVNITVEDPIIVPTQKTKLMLEITSRECELSVGSYHFELPDGWSVTEEKADERDTDDHCFSKEFTVSVGQNPKFTLPRSIAQYAPIESSNEAKVHFQYNVDGHSVSSSMEVKIDIAPPLLLSVNPKVARIDPFRLQEGRMFEYAVRNYFPHKIAGKIDVKVPAGWKAESSSFIIPFEDSSAVGKILVRPPNDVEKGDYALRFNTDYASDEINIKVFDVAVAKDLNVGAIKSYDNTLEAAAKELQVRYKLLDENDLESGDLSIFGTILIDIRAYLVREDLQKNHSRLLDYVRAGGNLVVMYQKTQEWKSDYAPFPFEITRKRVTVEEAPVEILHPEHALLNHPNKISSEDWSGWVQERGVYFPGNVPKEYIQLLSSHDPDEPALTTGYLVAGSGKGSYIYTSFVWYRQLKEMNSGALKCFANMISYPAFRN